MDNKEVKNGNPDVVAENHASVSHPEHAPSVGHDFEPGEARVTLRSLRAETEMQAISQALQQTGWNRKRAAQLLSISYRGLLYKIQQHNITKNQDLTGVPKRTKMADTLNTWESSDLVAAVGGNSVKE